MLIYNTHGTLFSGANNIEFDDDFTNSQDTKQGRIQDLEQGVLKVVIVTQRCSATLTFLTQLSAMYVQKRSMFKYCIPQFAPEEARLQERHPSCYSAGFYTKTIVIFLMLVIVPRR